MKKTTLFYVIIFCMLIHISAYSQNYFRSGIFLHHSTGQHIWGPNPDGTSTTTVPDQMHLYNIAHSYNGSDSVSMSEEWWTPGDNEWATQHMFFEGDTSYTDINYYLNNYKIIVVKSCFPSSEIDSWGQPADTATPDYKSVYNYKWHWMHIIEVMQNHPDNFFVIWTNAPLETNSTTLSQASLSKSFCKWAKDTLAAGLDTAFGDFPNNVYVFDYFSKLTGISGIELVQYRTAPGDSHPNGAATDLVAPQFVNEIFNAAIAYEQTNSVNNLQDNISIIKCFPNPSKGDFIISFPYGTNKIQIFNSIGQQIISVDVKNITKYNISINQNGIYSLRFYTQNKTYINKVVVCK